MDAVETMLAALERTPEDDTGWLALADCLGERGEDARAEMVRVQLSLRRDPEGDPAREGRLAELWRQGTQPCLPTRAGPAGLEFVLVPPGDFLMGAREGDMWQDDDERPRRRVGIGRAFWMARTPATRGQWRAFRPDAQAGKPEHPATGATWKEAQAFCRWAGAAAGLEGRLPTEAEWEYACRAGTSTLYFGGDEVADLRAVGWCSYDGEWDASGGTRPVGERRPNALGLSDMAGNVWEWCRDWYKRRGYADAARQDPVGPRRGRSRVVRGGSWRGGPWFCRSAERRAIPPSSSEPNVGCRAVAEWRADR